MTLVCFSNPSLVWMNGHGRKSQESKAIVCLSACSLEGKYRHNCKCGQFEPEHMQRGSKTEWESDAINLRPQRGEQEGWSRIELRILDSRVPQKASIRARTASTLISTDASLGCGERRRVDCISFLPCSTAGGGVHGHGGGAGWGDLLPRAFWRQAACELIERAVLIVEPAGPCAHARACSSIPAPLSAAFTQFCSRCLSSFYFMVSVFKDSSFVLWKAERLSHPFEEWTHCWIVEIVSCTETLTKSGVKQST